MPFPESTLIEVMHTFWVRVDDVLRQRSWVTHSAQAGFAMRWLTSDIVAFGLFYGAVMGAFGDAWGERFWQIVYSALKVPLLLLGTFLIALPSFFVLNTLFGLRRDFGEAIRALMATQAGLSIVLAALAPFTAL